MRPSERERVVPVLFVSYYSRTHNFRNSINPSNAICRRTLKLRAKLIGVDLEGKTDNDFFRILVINGFYAFGHSLQFQRLPCERNSWNPWKKYIFSFLMHLSFKKSRIGSKKYTPCISLQYIFTNDIYINKICLHKWFTIYLMYQTSKWSILNYSQKLVHFEWFE